jgi:hypothetical protein
LSNLEVGRFWDFQELEEQEKATLSRAALQTRLWLQQVLLSNLRIEYKTQALSLPHPLGGGLIGTRECRYLPICFGFLLKWV